MLVPQRTLRDIVEGTKGPTAWSEEAAAAGVADLPLGEPQSEA